MAEIQKLFLRFGSIRKGLSIGYFKQVFAPLVSDNLNRKHFKSSLFAVKKLKLGNIMKYQTVKIFISCHNSLVQIKLTPGTNQNRERCYKNPSEWQFNTLLSFKVSPLMNLCHSPYFEGVRFLWSHLLVYCLLILRVDNTKPVYQWLDLEWISLENEYFFRQTNAWKKKNLQKASEMNLKSEFNTAI